MPAGGRIITIGISMGDGTFMPFGAYGTGEDIANMVAFLAGEEERFITGTALTVDGGFNA